MYDEDEDDGPQDGVDEDARSDEERREYDAEREEYHQRVLELEDDEDVAEDGDGPQDLGQPCAPAAPVPEPTAEERLAQRLALAEADARAAERRVRELEELARQDAEPPEPYVPTIAPSPEPEVNPWYAKRRARFAEPAPEPEPTPNPLALSAVDDGDATEPDWLVHGLIERGSVVMIYGASERAKSWAAMDLAVAAETPREPRWLGRFDVEWSASIYVDFEQGPLKLNRRIAKLRYGRAETNPNGWIDKLISPALNLDHDAFYEALEEHAQEHQIIIVDSLRAAKSGSENDSSFADPLWKLKGIAGRTGCIFVVLHHEGKAKNKKTGVPDPRGTTAIVNACDLLFHLGLVHEAKDEHGQAILDIKMTQTKARDGYRVDPFTWRLSDDGAGGTSLWVQPELESAAKRPGRPAGPATAVDPADFAGRVRAALERHGKAMSQNRLAETVGGKREATIDQIKKMVEAGQLTRSKAGLDLT
jgi:AAA domain